MVRGESADVRWSELPFAARCTKFSKLIGSVAVSGRSRPRAVYSVTLSALTGSLNSARIPSSLTLLNVIRVRGCEVTPSGSIARSRILRSRDVLNGDEQTAAIVLGARFRSWVFLSHRCIPLVLSSRYIRKCISPLSYFVHAN